MKWPESIKALTLWQPWASLVALGFKKLETRGWDTEYRGPLVIHAARYVDLDFCQLPGVKEFLAQHGIIPEQLPRGAVVAVGLLVQTYRILIPTGKDCARLMLPKLIREPGGPVTVPVPEHETPWGNYWEPGRFAFQLHDVKAFSRPVPARGLQRLWDWRPQDAPELAVPKTGETHSFTSGEGL